MWCLFLGFDVVFFVLVSYFFFGASPRFACYILIVLIYDYVVWFNGCFRLLIPFRAFLTIISPLKGPIFG